ncbi:saccharopine dehydrogenase NADP-binding domain-containing protein [Gracilimonas sp.]|uniref:saccharopine dehydrogenase family protein n=1 Tax=Gracilimonas sp. TaxID=1974203 RepID=UPI0032EE3FA6
MIDKPFDLILIGATGFTGKRAAHYLKKHAPESFKWGIAARNPDKVTALSHELNIPDDRCFIVDNLNKRKVEEVVQKAKIIITTAGPFSLYGENVISACATYGTHYLDITGEVGFIKEMTIKYEKDAENSGALLIPFSGFDSVPADITSYLLQKEFDHPEKLSIKSYYSISGGFNGGTIATMLNKFETGEYKKMNDPSLLLNGDNVQQIHTPKDVQFFGFDTAIKRWSAPFIMGAINSKVVYKTADLMRIQGIPYAESISYSEHSTLGKWYNPLPFLVVSTIVLSITFFGPYKWFRHLLQKIMPAPGEGPSEEQIENGYFKLRAIARNEKGQKASLKMRYPGDPGNKSTVFFLCESALCLAENSDKLKSQSGIKTPISALGNLLVKRLSKRGLMITLAKE